MRARHGIKFTLFSSLIAGTVAAADSAAAQTEPVIVVPGRPGVPVMMNGVDVSGAIIEGEFGLNRPDSGYPRTVIMRYWPPDHYRNPGPYFPATGQKPHYGRREVIPPADRQMPPRAQRFYRDWSIESAPGPVSPTVPSDPAANGGAANGGAANGGAVNGGAVNGGAGLGAGQGLPSAAAAQSPMGSPARREDERKEGERENRRGEEGKTRRGEERERAPLFHPAPPPPPVHPAPPPRRFHAGPPPRRVHRAPRPHTP